MYNRKNMLEEIPEENTSIWSCTSKECKGWMRNDFTFEDNPTCPMCSSPMVSEMKMLPSLVNSNMDLKTIKKSAQSD